MGGREVSRPYRIFTSTIFYVLPCFYDTTFCGVPSMKAFTLAMRIFIRRTRASSLAQPMCGVMWQPGCASSGLVANGGSWVSTSTPAPIRCLLSSALAKASSSTSGPRAVLIRMAPRFICACRSAFTKPFVEALSGQWSDTTSLLANSVSCRLS